MHEPLLDTAPAPHRAPALVSPLPTLALALASGIALGAEGPLSSPLHLLYASLAASLIALLACLRSARLLPVAILITSATAGFLLGASTERPTASPELPAQGIAALTLVSPVREHPRGRSVLARLDALGPPGTPLTRYREIHVWLHLGPEQPEVALGDHLFGRIRLRPPRPPRFPGDYDARQTLRLRGAEHIAHPREPLLVQVPESPPPLAALRRALDRQRQRASAHLHEHGHTSGLLPALALGEGSAVDDATRESFSRCGLSHVLAVSGLHFGLVALVLFTVSQALFRRVPFITRRWGARRAAACVALPLMALYVLFVGAPVSARRAFVMAACLLGGHALAREGHSTLSLSLAALLLLLYEPRELFSPGFQLSFAAVLGLLWTGAYIERPFRRWLDLRAPRFNRALGWLGSALLATLGASVTTTPLVLLHFGQLPLVGMLANLWVVPVVSFVLLPAALLATLLVGVWPEAAQLLTEHTAAIEALLVESVVAFEHHAPLIALEAHGLSHPALILIGLLALTLLHTPHARTARALAAFSTAALVTLLSLQPPPHGGRLRVTFLPVGQGDATLIESPGGQLTLVDGGGGPRSDPGARVVVPYIQSLGYTRLDRVILTHPDLDHMGGLPSVIRSLAPREVWTNGHAVEHPAYLDLLDAIDAVDAEHHVWSSCAPTLVEEDTLRLSVLWPHRLDPEAGTNANSLVLRLEYGHATFLLMGDLEAEGERALLESGAALGATVLKAGHHGSHTSTTPALLDAVSPEMAVISVGEDNRYGLPHAQVLRRLVRRGVEVFRTDHDGVIRMETDGRRLVVSTW